MPRIANPHPTYTFYVDHALRIELRIKSEIRSINADTVVQWEYALFFGGGRAKFRGTDFVTAYTSPYKAVVELIKALGPDQLNGDRKWNKAQEDWFLNGRLGYSHVCKDDVLSIEQVPGAALAVELNGQCITPRTPASVIMDSAGQDTLPFEEENDSE